MHTPLFIAQHTIVAMLLIGGDPARASLPSTSQPLSEEQVQQTIQAAVHGRAVSLRTLQQMWKRCAANQNCPQEVLSLADVRWVLGYLIDRDGSDVILLGARQPSLPALRSSNLAIAVRNAARIYATRKGNTLLYSPPGCSIDPEPRVFAKLQSIGNLGLAQSPAINQWRRVCELPQQVRVMGVPFDSAWAAIMVDSDYLAKNFMDGSDRPIDRDFENVLDRRMAMAVSALHASDQAAVPMTSMSRIWFTSNAPQLLEDDQTVLIGAPFHVVVATEAELLTRSGFAGSGTEDPVVRDWARQFTKEYPRLRTQRPIYAQLEGLFRLTVLARAIEANKAFDRAGLSAKVLLEDAPIDKVAVRRKLNGCFNVRHHEERQKIPGGERRISLVMPSCGGVSMELAALRAHSTSARGERLRTLRTHVLTARKNDSALYWDY